MCIPIELDVPVVTFDWHEVGIAREILCPCPGDLAPSPAAPVGLTPPTHGANDLWLRVTRAARTDLYIPFGEILETRADGVRLRLGEDELAVSAWGRPPAGLPIPA